MYTVVMVERITPTTLTPAELESVTGLSTAMQRVWRQRGFLPSPANKHARFSLLEAAEMMVRHTLSARGFPPSQSSKAGAIAAPVVLWCALMDGDGACEVVGPESEVEAFEYAYCLDDKIIRDVVPVEGNPRRYLLAFDNEEPELEDGLGAVIDGSNAESGYFINLEVLGRRFVERLGRPLVKADLGDPQASPGERRRYVRRLLRSNSGSGE